MIHNNTSLSSLYHRSFATGTRLPPRVHQVAIDSGASSSSPLMNRMRRTARQIKDGGIYSVFALALIAVMG
jgi:hypothetical protein